MLPDLQALAGGSDQGAPEEPVDVESSGEDILANMLDEADKYGEVEKDQEDLHTMEQVRTLIQGLLAKQQKERDGMMQGKSTPSSMRRALGSPDQGNGAGY